MTETDWIMCSDPSNVLVEMSPISVKSSSISDRKLILFGCACCRRNWDRFVDDTCKGAVIAAEMFADGRCSEGELLAARLRVQAKHPNLFWTAEYHTFLELASYYTAMDLIGAAEQEVEHPLPPERDYLRYLAVLKDEVSGLVACAVSDLDESKYQREINSHCDYIRDIFGNPFRPVTLDPRWQSSTVVDLARNIYDERVFERMPILADALMDAGCDKGAISLLRQFPGENARWATRTAMSPPSCPTRPYRQRQEAVEIFRNRPRCGTGLIPPTPSRTAAGLRPQGIWNPRFSSQVFIPQCRNHGSYADSRSPRLKSPGL